MKQLVVVISLLCLWSARAEDAAAPAVEKIDVRKQIEALKSKYLDDREAAVAALKNAKEEVAPAIPEVLALLGHPNWQTQMCAAQALKNLGPAAKPAVEPLVGILTDAVQRKSSGLFDLVLGVLEAIGPDAVNAAVPQIIAALAKGNESLFETAGRRVEKLGPEAGKQALSVLVQTAKKPEGRTAMLAVGFIGEMGPAAGSAVPDLVEVLKARVEALDREAAKTILNTLKRIGPEAEKTACRAVSDTIKAADAGRLNYLRDILPLFGQAEKGDLSALVAARLSADEYDTVDSALGCLGALGSPASNSVPEVVKALRAWSERKEPRVFQAAVQAAERIGADAKARVMPLVFAGLRSANDKTIDAAWHAARRFGAVGQQDAIAALVDVLKGDNAGLATKAASWLGGMGTNAVAAAASLRAATLSQDQNLVKAAGDALKKVQPQ